MSSELDEAIARRCAQLGEELDDETAYQLLVELGDLLLERARTTGADVDEVLAVAGSLLDALDGASPARAAPLYQLGLAHAVRGERGDTAEFRTAVGYLQQARPLVDVPEVIARIGLITSFAVAALEELEHVDAALTDLRTAYDLLPDSPLRDQVRFRRGSMHLFRYLAQGGDETDRLTATEDLTATLEVFSDERTSDACHLGLAMLHSHKSVPAELRSGRGFAGPLPQSVPTEDFADARRHLSALSPTAAEDPAMNVVNVLFRAGADFHDSTPEDWANAIGELDSARANWPEDEPGERELVGLQAALASMLAKTSGSSEDTDTASAQLAAAAAALPPDSPMRSLLLSGLRMTSTGFAQEPGDLDLEDVGSVVRRLEHALEHFADDDPDRAEVLTQLVGALFLSVATSRDESPDLLDRVREMTEQAIERSAADPVNMGINHVFLSMAEGFHAINNRDGQLLNSAVANVQRADELLPAEHRTRRVLKSWLGNLLTQRYMTSGGNEDLEAARQLAAESGGDDLHARYNAAFRHFSPHLDDAEGLGRSAEELERLLADMPHNNVLRPRAESSLATFQLLQKALTSHGSDLDQRERDEMRRTLQNVFDAAEEVPDHHIDKTGEMLGAASICITSAFAMQDLPLVNRGISMLAGLSSKPDLFPRERRNALGMLATSLRHRYELTRDPRDLSNAVNRFEQILREFEFEPGEFENASVLNSLANCYFTRNDRMRRDPQRAIATALDGLRERARTVLLQSSARRALKTASAATGEAAEVSHWCLALGQPEDAVQALELGRGMVLHAATVEATMSDLLREHGRADLAERWISEVGQQQPWDVGALGGTDVVVPSDLRTQVLRTFHGTDVEAQLLSPPPVKEIAAGLSSTRTRALVYLLPGVAVLVTADGQVEQVRSLQLTEDGPVARFDQAQRQRARGEPVEDEWRAALEAVCDWAWSAVLNPVLDLLAGSGRQRIVLVPVGKLGAVPWHAARRRVPGGKVRYACQDAVLCYAASARQFLDAARREVRPWDSEPVLLRTPELHWSRHEMGHIHRTHYQHGSYLGKPRDPRRRDRQPPPKPDDVLALLPTASLLHLACHATPAELPVESALLLGAREVLPVQDVLRQARDRPRDAAGALVVLAACASDLTDRQHDEVLTLSTAFLAAGAAGVIGTRWEVLDLPTAMFMIVFHHFLNSGSTDPAGALRAAQLWMLDPRRRPLPGIPEELAAFFTEVDPTAPQHWAAFTYQGR
ncbi:CHAT domain-containing protein [Saccharopolyspora sp. NPDC002686]|uniref:CHAT domain-containing protein n=1 Tax=Saccharopolyspora sp. NPDC002686 TaxID=3154541 RepID=UPI00333470A9